MTVSALIRFELVFVPCSFRIRLFDDFVFVLCYLRCSGALHGRDAPPLNTIFRDAESCRLDVRHPPNSTLRSSATSGLARKSTGTVRWPE